VRHQASAHSNTGEGLARPPLDPAGLSLPSRDDSHLEFNSISPIINIPIFDDAHPLDRGSFAESSEFCDSAFDGGASSLQEVRQSSEQDLFKDGPFGSHHTLDSSAVDDDLAVFTGFAYDIAAVEEGRKYVCPMVSCGERFKRQYDVQRHVDSVHSVIE
jgi:hypothetical protein